MPPREQTPSVLDIGTPAYQMSIGEDDLLCMFVHLMRCRQVFLEAKAHISVELFDRVREPHWAVLWATLYDLDKDYGGWAYESLVHAVSHRQRQDASAMSPRSWDALLRPDEQGIIFSTFASRESDMMPDYGRNLVRQFLQERTVVMPLTRVMRSSGDAYVQNFSQLLAEANARASRIDAVRELPAGLGMPAIGSPLPPPIPVIPTTLTYFDRHIEGRRRGDANGILGVRGAGKTTMGIDLAITEAKNCFARRAAGGPDLLSVFMSYEEPEEKLIRRCWSNATKIRSSKLDMLTDWNMLTTAANLDEYERNMEAVLTPNQIVMGERERYEEAMVWFNRHFVFVDMSGSGRYPKAGRGGVDEIVAMLNRVQEERNQGIDSVVIDYAGLVCRRYMTDRNIPADNIRHYLGPMGDRIRCEVAIRFDCTAWIMHQLASDQGKRSATTKLTDLDAAEAHNFAENLAACGCLGVADPRTGCQLFNWSKVRYRKQWEHAPSVIMLDGAFCRFNDVSARYRADSVTRSFMNPNESQVVYGADDNRHVGVPTGIPPVGMES